MKFPHRYKIYDVLHKSAVAFLISGTLVGIAMFVSQGYFYFRDVRPERIEKEKKYYEEKLAQEQKEKEQMLLREKEQYLLQKQAEAESIKA